MENKIQIQKTVEQNVKKISKILSIKKAKVAIKEVEADKKYIYKDLGGVGGYCPNSHTVQISIDFDHSKFKKQSSFLIVSTLAHELYHTAQRQAGINISHGTFLECLWSEGLADYFSYKFTGKKTIWLKKLNESEYSRLIKKAQNIFSQKMTDRLYDDWFLKGSHHKNLSRWTGYALGFEMIKRYLKHHPDESVVSLINIPAKKINR